LKKIVLIGPAYPYRGGNSLYISHLYDELKKKFDVTIINFSLLYPGLLFPGTTQEDKSNVFIKQAPSLRIINSVNPFSWFKAANVIKKINADLVIFDWWNPFFGPCFYAISKLIKKFYKNKILFITENVISHEKRFIDKMLTKAGLKNADIFVALSRTVEENIKYYAGNRKVYKSALPVYDCYIFDESGNIGKIKTELGFQENEKIVLFFGYVRKYKGLTTLIDAMSEVLKRYPEARLLIVGEFYDSPVEYVERIKSNGLGDKVKVVQKFVPNEEVGKYYSIADVVVLPYRSATQSGILNISYGFKKPVVVTRVGSLPDDVEENKTGVVVEPDDFASVAEGICKVLELSETVDFEFNIKEKVSKQEFLKINSLIENIITESE